jgi:hypothetical protein
MLQLVIYAWLWQMLDGESISVKYFRLFNIKTGELYELSAKKEELDIIILALLRGKYNNFEPKTDEEFLIDCGVDSVV